jgi:hypothetical protein
MPPPNAVTLYDQIQNLKLNVATIAPIHGRGAVPIAEFRKFIGRNRHRDQSMRAAVSATGGRDAA